MPIFDPKTLADEFDPAIISFFEHENVGDQPPFEMLLTAYAQYADLLSAYQFAKDVVLPFIRANGRNAITATILLNWLDQAHARIAASLGKAAGFTAGQYSEAQVFRWHWGMLTQDIIFEFLTGKNHRDEIFKLALKNGLAKDKALALINVLEKIRDLKQFELAIKASRMIFSEADQHTLGATKLAGAYHHRLLSKNELASLDDLVVICRPPEEYPQAMKEFAARFVAQWARCDASNDEQLAHLHWAAYQGIGGIHPYGNGNGRLATWLMNVINRSLDKPSFLMREKGERFNAKSDYSLAIENIDKNPDIFKKHVLRKIQKATSEGHAESVLEYDIVMKRHEIYRLLLRIQSKSTQHNLNQLAHVVLTSVQDNAAKQFGLDRCKALDPEVVMFAANLEYTLFNHFYLKLNESHVTQASSSKTPTVTACQYSKADIDKIHAALNVLTTHDQWKAYRHGTTMLLYLNNDDEAQAIISQLTASGAGVAVLKRNPENKMPVVQFDNIHLLKLEQYVAAAKSNMEHKAKDRAGLK